MSTGIIARLIAPAALLGAMPALAQDAAAPTPPAAPTKVAEGDAKIICKRFSKIGSLVARERVCKTRREWQNEHDNLRMPPQTAGSCAAGGYGGC